MSGSAPTEITGHTASTYRLIRLIGAGGMGEVYLAHDDKLDRRVAVKLIASRMSGDAEGLRRFRQEARLASSLSHPNIVAVHDFGELDDRPFIVTELVDGETLGTRLSHGAMPIADAVEIAVQVAGALAAAHECGLIHRDIKPDNVMVRPDGYVKVLDFGLAKPGTPEAIANAAAAETTAEIVCGTPAYMSPEQAAGQSLDARTDVFSLGAVLYEMVTGRRAFGGSTVALVFADILGGTVTPPSRINAEVSPELEAIILKSLARDRDARYQRALDLRADLVRLHRGAESRRRGWLMPALLSVGAAAILIVATRFGLRASHGSAAPAQTMLAVLPFESIGADASDEYFADGLTEEMTAKLGQLQPDTLGVIARTSAARYKHTTEAASQIGRELGVGYLLEGSVRRSGDRIRITAQLVRASAQTEVWADVYERPLVDVLVIQREIAEQLTRALSIRLLPGSATARESRSVDFESYDKYLLALHELGKGTRQGDDTAIQYLHEAAVRDPANARTQEALATAYASMTTYYSSPSAVMPLAREAAQRALDLDPSLAAAHVTLGDVLLLYEWNWTAAEREYRRALDLNPNLPEAQLGYATYLATLGRFDEAIGRIQQAYLFDPLALESRAEAMWIYYFSGRMPDTIDQARKTIQLEPQSGLPYAMLALASANTGNVDQTRTAAADAMRLTNSPSVMTAVAMSLAHIHDTEQARQILDRALALANERYLCRFMVAETYIDLGDLEQALSSLEQGYGQRST